VGGGVVVGYVHSFPPGKKILVLHQQDFFFLDQSSTFSAYSEQCNAQLPLSSIYTALYPHCKFTLRNWGGGGGGGIFALASLNCACIFLEGRVKGERNRCYYFSAKMQKLSAKNLQIRKII
jgi:hypothetical protein